MRRYASGEPSSAFSLFPFLAVLLCTMGALAVLLIAMSQVSKDKAARKAILESRKPSEKELYEEQQLKLQVQQAELYEQQVNEREAELSKLLAEKQKQLSDVEDHVRRLQEQMEALQAEAMEIIKLDEIHVEDHTLAEEEIQRLKELRDELEKENRELAEQGKNDSRQYAIVPLRDRDNGTRRPAVYIECVKDGVILQPEGIKLTRKDFAKPVHVSSPLAAAMRAIQQHYVDYPHSRANGEEGAPYPLLVIRPEGVKAYYLATQVLESVDADYGYQPIAADWDVEYDQPDPVMAESVMRAIKLARFDRERLSAAAPQYFQHNEGYWGEESEDLFAKVSLGVSGQTGENPFSGAEFSGPVDGYLPNGISGAENDGYLQGSKFQSESKLPTAYQGLTKETQPNASIQEDADYESAQLLSQGQAGPAGLTSQDSLAEQLQQAANSALSNDVNELASSIATDDSESNESSGSGSEELSGVATSSENQASVSAVSTNSQQGQSDYKGASSKVNKKKGIGILRLVPLQINQGSVAIVEIENTVYGQRYTARSEAIDMRGNPNEWMPQLLNNLQKHASSWGIAGEGMYWKSKIVLHVDASSGEQAKKLANYLRQSGIEIHRIDVASEQGGSDAKLR